MTTKTTTITANTVEPTQFQTYRQHVNETISGIFEVGGDFDGGTLSFLISYTSGDVINPMRDLTAQDYEITAADTVCFEIPVFTNQGGQASDITLYYELEDATSPNITLTVADNR